MPEEKKTDIMDIFTKGERFMLITLMNILKYHTWHGNEEVMRPYMISTLEMLGFKCEVDSVGNIAAIRGEAERYPLLNAHMDIVRSVAYKAEQEIKKRTNKGKTVVQTVKQLTSGRHIEKKKKKCCTNCVFLDACINTLVANDTITERAAYWKLKYSKGCDQFTLDATGYNEMITKLYDTNYEVEYEDDADYGSEEFWRNWARRNAYDKDCSVTYTTSYGMTKEEKLEQDAVLNEIYEIKFEEKTGKISTNEMRVLGGDDKCGIALALATAYAMPKTPMKLLFTVGEESGCVGISEFCKTNPDWFKDVKYSVTIDRRGDDNLLMWSAGKKNCSKEFAAQLALHGVNAGIPIKVESGTIADVIHIREHVKETVNISAGYHNPHSTTEWIDFYAMCDILKWIQNIVRYAKV